MSLLSCNSDPNPDTSVTVIVGGRSCSPTSMSTAPSSPSSRRSSHSTLPGRWGRTISTSKSQQSASVSLVFAQPEQGSKLRSAIDQLPVYALDDTSSTASIRSKKRERLLSTSTAGRQFESTESGLDRKRTRTQSTATHRPDVETLAPPAEEETVQRSQVDECEHLPSLTDYSDLTTSYSGGISHCAEHRNCGASGT